MLQIESRELERIVAAVGNLMVAVVAAAVVAADAVGAAAAGTIEARYPATMLMSVAMDAIPN